jgi:hypothetical protein
MKDPVISKYANPSWFILLNIVSVAYEVAPLVKNLLNYALNRPTAST